MFADLVSGLCYSAEMSRRILSLLVLMLASLLGLLLLPPIVQNQNIEEVRECTKRISDAGHRASQVIDGIRAMFQKGGQERKLLDVNQLIREVLELVRGRAQKERVLVRSDLFDEMRPVQASRIQLQQVMLNLVMNAIDAMDTVTDGPRLLRVTSALRAPDDVLIAVEDSGPGIAPKDIHRIFDPFFTTKPHGMGMGLAICRSIV
jgi:C4-dicarboxylate-specific signal transduction histidine kinase